MESFSLRAEAEIDALVVNWNQDEPRRLTVTGELDASSSALLSTAIERVIDAGESTVAVHMADVTFIDSSGLGALIAGYKKAEASGGNLCVTEPAETVTRLLQLTGQYDRFVAGD